MLSVLLLSLLFYRIKGQCQSYLFKDSEPSISFAPLSPAQIPNDALNLVPYPRLPIVTNSDNSQVASLPNFPTFTDSAYSQRVNCPHLQNGLSLWHNPSSWYNNTIPDMSPGANITIPNNSSILISSCSIPNNVVLGTITVPFGSSLVFADANITLHVNGLIVKGSLLIGSETCRLRSYINITLHGSRPNNSPDVNITMPESYKGIEVNNGTIDVHGALYSATWTRLASNAKINDTWIYVQDPVNWEVGQSIIIVTTVFKDSRDYHENEQRQIVRLFQLDSVYAIQIDNPLKYNHYAGPEYQAEVAMLSRRIIIQGSYDDSEPTDTMTNGGVCNDHQLFSSYPCANVYLTGYGGHVMIHGPLSVGRMSGVLLLRMGQTNFLGRYPFHLHLIGSNGFQSFVQDTVVYKSYYRCYTVHMTDGSRLSRNIAYDATGHCYYMEDGVEENNLFEFNLGGHIHVLGVPPSNNLGWNQYLPDFPQSQRLVHPADVAASAFYVTNMHNSYVGNTAFGGWSGFAFPNLATPIGPDRGVNVNPSSRPSLLFTGNVAHSSGYWWNQAGCMYSGGTLSYSSASSDQLIYNPGRGTSSKNAPNIFNNTKVYLCNVGFMHWGSNPYFYNFEAHDFMRTMTIFGNAVIDNALFHCRSNNAQKAFGSTWFENNFNTGSMGVFQWYDTGQSHILSNIVFRDCINRKAQITNAWQMLTHSDQFVPEFMQITRNVTYQNVSLDSLIAFTVTDHVTVSGRSQNWFDYDGTASLRPGKPTVIGSAYGNDWWRLDTNCTRSNQWNLWLCDAINPVTGKTRSSGTVYITFDSALQAADGITNCTNGSGEPCYPIGRVSHVGYSHSNISSALQITPYSKITGPLNGYGWFVTFDKGTPADIQLSSMQMDWNDSMVLVFQYPTDARINVIAHSTCHSSWCVAQWPFRNVASPDIVRTDPNADVYYFNHTSGHLYVRVTCQRGWTLGNQVTWTPGPFNDRTFDAFSYQGMRIPVRTYYGYYIEINATCSNQQGNYCVLDQVIEPPSPCPNGNSNIFDGCNSATAISENPKSNTTVVQQSSNFAHGRVPDLFIVYLLMLLSLVFAWQ